MQNCRHYHWLVIPGKAVISELNSRSLHGRRLRLSSLTEGQRLASGGRTHLTAGFLRSRGVARFVGLSTNVVFTQTDHSSVPPKGTHLERFQDCDLHPIPLSQA